MPTKRKLAPKKKAPSRTDACVAFTGFTSDIGFIHTTVRAQILDDKSLDTLTLNCLQEARKALDEYEQAGDQGGKSWVQRYKARLTELLDQYRQACRSRWPDVKPD